MERFQTSRIHVLHLCSLYYVYVAVDVFIRSQKIASMPFGRLWAPVFVVLVQF